MTQHYASVTVSIVEEDGDDNWTILVSTRGLETNPRPAQWLVVGPLQDSTYHDICNVFEANLYRLLVHRKGIQQLLDF